MTWVLRDATAADKAALADFVCDSGADCITCAPNGGNVHESEIESYLRHHAVDQMEWRRPYNDHKLLLLFDPDGKLAGAVSHEQSELKVRGEVVAARRLVVVGLRLELQGNSLGEHRLSSHLLAAAVRDMADEPPELLFARVAVCNPRCQKLLVRHGMNLELSQQDPLYSDQVGVYGQVVKTLPPPPDFMA